MLTFRAFGRKTPIVRKIWEILESFQKFYFKNRLKCITLAYFQKNLTNPVLLFCAFGRKILIVWKLWENFENFWWKFNRKIEFLASFGKVVAKNRAFGNNTIFLEQFFRFRGGGTFPVFPPPLAAPMIGYNVGWGGVQEKLSWDLSKRQLVNSKFKKFSNFDKDFLQICSKTRA